VQVGVLVQNQPEAIRDHPVAVYNQHAHASNLLLTAGLESEIDLGQP
jgi:hypothetical protein